MTYQIRYTTRAATQKDTLPPAGKAALATLENRLRSDPTVGHEDKRQGCWRVGFGGYGDAEYVFSNQIVTVTMLFITWAG